MQNTLEFCQRVGDGGGISRGEVLLGVGGRGQRGLEGVEGVEGNDADFGGLKTAEFPMSELRGGIGLFYGIQQHRDVPRFPAIGG